MMRKLLKGQDGMMTVEAAVLVPVISFLLVGIVFFLLFFMDMSAAKSEAMRTATETAAAWKTGGSLTTGEYDVEELLSRDIYYLVTGSRGELTGEAKKRMNRRIRERLLITTLRKTSVTIGVQSVKVKADLRFRWQTGGVEAIMGDMLSFSCTVTSPVENWEEQLRLGASMQCNE